MSQDEAVRLARETVAESLGIDAADVALDRVRSVEWKDESLGCPREGETYEAVSIPGYHVVLRVGRRSYNVHVGEGRAVLCDYLKAAPEPSIRTRPRSNPPPIPPGTRLSLSEHPELEDKVRIAKEDLAARLGIDIDDIELEELRAVVWPDGSLGCPQPGRAYIQVLQEGLFIRLRAGDTDYPYHSGGRRPPFLCENGESK